MLRFLGSCVCAVALVGARGVLPSDCGGPHPALAAGTKTVTVSAGSEAEALKLAEKQNPGWTAISATKTAPKDPKSRQWGVKMEKK